MRRTAKALVAALALLSSLGAATAIADTAPTVTIEAPAPGAVDYKSAQLSGHVNPNGGPSGLRVISILWPALLAVLANRAASLRAKASGALPSRSSRRRLTVLIAAALSALASIVLVPAAFAAPPTTSIDPVGAHSISTAQVSGTIDVPADGKESYYGFQYSTDGVTWSSFAYEGPIAPGSGPTPLEATLTGLAAGTPYEVRLATLNFDESVEEPSPEPNPTFTTDPAPNVPALTLDPAAPPTSSSAEFSGSLDPEGGNVDSIAGQLPISWRFQVSRDPSGEGWRDVGGATIEGSDAKGDDPIDLHANASDLEPNTTYHYRLAATYAGLEVTTPELTFQTSTAAPTVFVWANTPESSTEVLLRGAVNPQNSPLARCEFVYGTTTAYGESASCEGTVEGAMPVPVEAHLADLQPGIRYHYRLVADNGTGGEVHSDDASFETFTEPGPEGACPNEAIREEQHSTFLPDCRAYEQASPAQKLGGNVSVDPGRTQAALSGDAVTFTSPTPFGDAAGSGISTEFLGRRTGLAGTSGWITHALFPQVEPTGVSGFSKTPIYQGSFSQDLSKGVLHSYTPLSDEPNVAGVSNIYLREDALSPGPGTYTLLSACPGCSSPLADPTGYYRPQFAAATPDLGHVIFEARQTLTPDAPPDTSSECTLSYACAPQLYEWDQGTLRYVGLVPPSGSIECGGASPTCLAAPVSVAGRGAVYNRYSTHAISEDGAKIFFMVPKSSHDFEGDLYMRLDHSTTVQLNASERTPPDQALSDAKITAISGDGSRAFFTSTAQLTDGPGGDLYVYDTTLPAGDPHNLAHVYLDQQLADGDASTTTAMLGTSDDGSYAYFTNPNALLPGQSSPLPAGQQGLYRWHNGNLSLIGTIDDNAAGILDNSSGYWGDLRARVTPDGRSLLFMALSGSGLTGYDHGHTCFANSTVGESPCSELYLYSSDSNALHCVSCNPSGAPGTADADVALRATGGTAPSSYLNHPLSDDGRHVFFQSGEQLAPEDTNGASDVYQWTAAGAGECGTSSSHFQRSAGGCLDLISSGAGPEDSYFLDATPDGHDVFFATSQKLVGWDADATFDLYDARVGGGLPQPAPVPAPCRGDGCSTFTSPPSATNPRSPGFIGPANPTCRRKHHRHHHRECAHKRRHRSRAPGKRGGSR